MLPLEVTALDHIYVAVADLSRSVAFYDPVMKMLGFVKGTRAIAGEPHVHYYNRVMQYTLRAARSPAPADPYSVGAVHHLCFRVATPADVDEAARRLEHLGVAATPPRLYEYRDDYYATFFSDPDGIRLEVVADTALRRTVRSRWREFDRFEDPVAHLPLAPPTPPTSASLLAGIPTSLRDELVTVLATGADVRVERIVSRGHTSPPGFWYDQNEREFVAVIAGAARLGFENRPPMELGAGDWLVLEPHVRHRVEWTPAQQDTVWLAVFFT